MKKLIFISLALALATSLVALAQESAKPDQMKHDSMKGDKMGKAVSVSGKIGDDGKTFVDKEGKTWTLSNPEAVKGHEGHEVTIKGHEDAAKSEIHVVSLKMAKGGMKETKKSDDNKY